MSNQVYHWKLELEDLSFRKKLAKPPGFDYVHHKDLTDKMNKNSIIW